MKGMIVKLSVAAAVLLICTLSLFFSSTGTSNVQSSYRSEVLANYSVQIIYSLTEI